MSIYAKFLLQFATFKDIEPIWLELRDIFLHGKPRNKLLLAHPNRHSIKSYS